MGTVGTRCPGAGKHAVRAALAAAFAIAALVALARPAVAAAAVPADFFGLYSEDAYRPSPQGRDAIFREQVDAGAGLVRQPFDWSVIEPVPGGWHFDELDDFMIAATRAGVSVLPTLVNSPAWASSAPPRRAHGVYPPARLSDFQTYARALIERYGPDGVFWNAHPELIAQPIRAWQVWNEPNIPYFWPAGPDAGEYTKLLKASGDAIHAADPGALVVSAGITTSDMGPEYKDYIESMYAAGAKGHFDILGVHPYAIDAGRSMSRLREARSVMDAYGDHSRMWATEFGWASSGDPSAHTTDEPGQAAELESLLRKMVAARSDLKLRGAIYYNWRDSISSSPGAGSWPARAGLLRLDGTRKPAYFSFRRVALDLVEESPPEQPAQGTGEPVSTPADGAAPQAPPTRPVVRVSGPRTVTVGKRGWVRLRLECAAPAVDTRCAGGIRIEHRYPRRGVLVLARRHYALSHGSVAVLRLKLTSRGRKVVARSRRVRAKVAFVGTAPDRRLSLVLKPKRR